MANRPGALVISLDFELHWGIRDHVTRDDAPYGRLPRARAAVEDMVELFVARDIRATWATVGFLFASTRDEVDGCEPDERPRYSRSELDPYVEAIGIDEQHDPEHLAASLVELIRAGHGQEVGSHTFSHYYCLEPGQDEATFRADLSAARAIAQLRGVELTSLVLPRNQWNPAYETAVLDLGFNCIRGPQRSWGHRARGPAVATSCPVQPGWRTPTWVRRLLPRRHGATWRSRLAFATCPRAHSCARTTQPASGSNLCGWPACARDCATRRTTVASSTCGGTRTISRSTNLRTSQCSGRSSTNTIGLPPPMACSR